MYESPSRKLMVERRGQGERHHFLLLHGFLGSGRNLWSLARRLIELDATTSCWCVDLPGHGDSDPPEPPYSLANLAQPIVDWMRSLEVPRWTVVGHSLGGRVGLKVGRSLEDRLSRTILLDISPSAVSRRLDLSTVLELFLSAPEVVDERGSFRDYFQSNGLSGPLTEWLLLNAIEREGRWKWKVDRQVLRQIHESTRSEDLWRDLEATGAERVACLYGGESAYVTPEDIARYRTAGCALHAVPGVGHFVHVEALNDVVDTIRKWSP